MPSWVFLLFHSPGKVEACVYCLNSVTWLLYLRILEQAAALERVEADLMWILQFSIRPTGCPICLVLFFCWRNDKWQRQKLLGGTWKHTEDSWFKKIEEIERTIVKMTTFANRSTWYLIYVLASCICCRKSKHANKCFHNSKCNRTGLGTTAIGRQI